MTEVILNADLLTHYSPFNGMKGDSLNEVLLKAELVSISKGKMLFKRSDECKICHWLVSGKLDLVDASYETRQIEASTDSPLSEMLENQSNYHNTAVAVEDCVLFTFNKDELDLFLTVDQVDEGNDWMTRLLQSRLFELIPPANIQMLFDKFETVNYSANDVVINEGDLGDYFYVVKTGRLSIDRQIDGEKIHLVQIGPGSFFGEDALVREEPRNATITMLSTGILMRLGKEDFTALMVEPATDYASIEEIKSVIAGGEELIRLIDVRQEEEYKQDIELAKHGDLTANAIIIPFSQLRDATANLESGVVYVVSTPGRRGELASFVLNQAGFDTYLLRR